jgi:hypothetical protein
VFCPKCGKPAQPGSHFCGQCGAALLAPEVTSSKRITVPIRIEPDVTDVNLIGDADTIPPPRQRVQSLKEELARTRGQLREVVEEIERWRAYYNQAFPTAPEKGTRYPYQEQEVPRLQNSQARRQLLQQRIAALEEHIQALEDGQN